MGIETCPGQAAENSDIVPDDSVSEAKKMKSEDREVSSYDETKRKLLDALETDGKYIDAVKTKQNELLEAGNLPLSKEDFGKLFFAPGSEGELADIKQVNYRNARLTASIDALRRSPYFELVMRSILKPGEIADTWRVNVPFTGSGKKDIEIGKNDIEPETTIQNILDKFKIYKVDTRATTRPLDSTDGFKILESTILKVLVPGAVGRSGKLNRKLAEKVIYDSILPRFLGEECFVKYQANGWEYDKNAAAYIDAFLEGYNSETFVATAEIVGYDSEVSTYQGNKVKLKSSYAHYSITGVDRELKTVSFSDPDDTSGIITVDYETFKKIFRSIDAARIDHKKLLEQIRG